MSEERPCRPAPSEPYTNRSLRRYKMIIDE